MSLFIQWPLLTVVPGLIFLGLYRTSGKRWPAIAGVLWLVYGVYELGMQQRWLCTGECNIRVDLLLIYPLLAVVSLAGLVSAARRRPDRTPAP
jgi:hypothetical protein